MKTFLRTIVITLILAISASSLESCKRTRTYKGKIKKNKPIPCPVKDC